MAQCIAEWHVDSTIDEARRVREEMAEVLRKHDMKHIDAFQLACAELIVNLTRYPDPKPTEIIMTISRDEHYWWMELKDNGPSFNNFSQQLTEADSLVAAENGMGLKLLSQMFTDIRYIPACYREDAYNLMLLRMSDSEVQEHPLTILVVDDDPSFRTVIKAYLHDSYQVLEAESVADAFEKVVKYPPDLVICDIQMPEQNGTALFDQISHIPDASDIAFIYISGCEDKDQIRKALSRPIDDFLEKPVEKTSLVNSLERVIQRRSYLKEQIKHEFEQKITLGLKPNLPGELPGYNVQVRSLNPEAGGGDLVQLQENGPDNVLLMADLMGHGLSAKGYVYALAGYLRGLFSATSCKEMTLPDLFTSLSKGFDEDRVLKETLATLIAVKISEEGKMEWVNAGQPYPILIRAEEVSSLKIDGPLPGLGVADYEPYTQKLKSGERVLIYSDGFCDAALPLSKSIFKVIEETRLLPLSSAADAILSERLKEKGLDDDLTFIILEKL